MPIFKRFAKPTPITVRDVMSTPPVIATEDSALNEVARLMWDKKVGCAVIVDPNGKIAGVITERDILYSAANGLFEKRVAASSVMSKNVVSIDPEGSIPQAIQKMRDFNIRHLPVVNSKGIPLGMLSIRDLLELAFEFLSVLQPPD